MKKIVCLALMGALVSPPFAGLSAQTQGQAPGGITGTVLQSTGVISGSVRLSFGSKPEDGKTEIHLVNAGDMVVARTETKDGAFTLPPIALGTYTLRCVQKDDGKVFGMKKVTLAGPSESVDMVCGSEAGVFWKKWGVLTGLGAAVAAAGGAAIVATKGDASGAR